MVMPTNLETMFFFVCLFLQFVQQDGSQEVTQWVSMKPTLIKSLFIILYIDEILSIDFLDLVQARLFQSNARNVGIQNEYL